MVIEDQLEINSFMADKAYVCNNFAHTLRKNIFMEHFGLDDNLVIDPMGKKFLETIEN